MSPLMYSASGGKDDPSGYVDVRGPRDQLEKVHIWGFVILILPFYSLPLMDALLARKDRS